MIMNKAMLEYLENVEILQKNNWDGRLYPEEWIHVHAFEQGQMCAKIESEIKAFGAIRRAAEVAWELEEDAGCHEFQSEFYNDCMEEAAAIRRAIRAAIGSEKV